MQPHAATSHARRVPPNQVLDAAPGPDGLLHAPPSRWAAGRAQRRPHAAQHAAAAGAGERDGTGGRLHALLLQQRGALCAFHYRPYFMNLCIKSSSCVGCAPRPAHRPPVAPSPALPAPSAGVFGAAGRVPRPGAAAGGRGGARGGGGRRLCCRLHHRWASCLGLLGQPEVFARPSPAQGRAPSPWRVNRLAPLVNRHLHPPRAA